MSEGKPIKQGSVAERQADLCIAYDEAWELLVPSDVASTDVVVEENASTGRMSGLALTRAERDEILRKLRATFGDDITRGLQAGQVPLTASAAALYQVIGDPKRQLRGQ